MATLQPAILYARFSPRRDPDDCESIDQQLERLTAYCRLQQLEPVETIRDPEVSGAVPIGSRPGGSQLLRLLAGGKRACHVVVQRIDRLSRDAADLLQVVRAWDRRGVSLHLADQGGCSINTATSFGRFVLTQMASVAELELNLICERTRESMLRHQRNGRRMSNVAPYGYAIDSADSTRLVPISFEQAVIDRARRWNTDGFSLRQIAAFLADWIPCRGGTWNHQTVRKMITRGV